MKADIYSLDGKKMGSIELPEQFLEEIRPDLIMRAYHALESLRRQPYGAYYKAGQRASALLSRRRRDFKTSYGYGISRVPRKRLWRRGRQFGFVGAFAPGTVKGRRAHPPKSQKILEQKINKKENSKAILSAISATVNIDAVKARGHRINGLVSVVDSGFENLKKTSDVINMLNKFNFSEEIERTSQRSVRAGKGKSRGRKYKTKKGVLFVVSNKCSLEMAAANIPGVEVCTVNSLNVFVLAPGGIPGRLTIYSKSAIEKMDKEKLFIKK